MHDAYACVHSKGPPKALQALPSEGALILGPSKGPPERPLSRIRALQAHPSHPSRGSGRSGPIRANPLEDPGCFGPAKGMFRHPSRGFPPFPSWKRHFFLPFSMIRALPWKRKRMLEHQDAISSDPSRGSSPLAQRLKIIFHHQAHDVQCYGRHFERPLSRILLLREKLDT